MSTTFHTAYETARAELEAMENPTIAQHVTCTLSYIITA